MEEILLTIAIPTYNRKKFVCRMLEMIKDQSLNSVEILINDNKSTDGTKEYIEAEYKWVKFYQNSENLGADYNFLQCYKKAKGKYVLLMGSDDVLTENSILNMLKFINKYESMGLPLIFLNHCFFIGDYTRIQDCDRIFIEESLVKTGVEHSKKEFMEITKDRLLFMSCFLVRRELFLKIKNPEKYIGTSFLHTCIAFEVSEKSDSFGVIGYPCIAANSTPGDAGLQRDPKRYFDVFGLKMKYVFCEIATKYGFDSKQMKSIYYDAATYDLCSQLVKLKANNYADVNIIYNNSIYGRFEDFTGLRFLLFLIYHTPNIICKLLYKVVHNTKSRACLWKKNL